MGDGVMSLFEEEELDTSPSTKSAKTQESTTKRESGSEETAESSSQPESESPKSWTDGLGEDFWDTIGQQGKATPSGKSEQGPPSKTSRTSNTDSSPRPHKPGTPPPPQKKPDQPSEETSSPASSGSRLRVRKCGKEGPYWNNREKEYTLTVRFDALTDEQVDRIENREVFYIVI